jgi:hypothetical protein
LKPSCIVLDTTAIDKQKENNIVIILLRNGDDGDDDDDDENWNLILPLVGDLLPKEGTIMTLLRSR